MPHGEPILSYGYLGVDFFFLLSGFILAGAHGATFATRYARGDHLKFLRRRSWRLLPLHWSVLAVVAITTLIFGQLSGRGSLLQEFALLNAWFPGSAELNGPDWSLSTEWAANLAFPLLAYMTLSPTRPGQQRAILSVILSVAGLLFCAFRHQGSLDTTTPPFALIRCFAEFSIGMILYRFRNRVSVLNSDRTLAVLTTGLAILIVLRASNVVTVSVMAAGLVGVAGNRSRFSSFLSIPAVHWLGKISFSIYLVHLPLLLLVRQTFVGNDPLTIAMVCATAIPTVLAISAVTHRYIEMRFVNGL